MKKNKYVSLVIGFLLAVALPLILALVIILGVSFFAVNHGDTVGTETSQVVTEVTSEM